MAEELIGFLIWEIVGAAFVCYGLIVLVFRKPAPIGFWANAKMFAVNDVKKYNRAVGKMFCIFGLVFIILGFPLLHLNEHPAWILLSVAGTMIESIIMMAVYVVVIEKKYRK